MNKEMGVQRFKRGQIWWMKEDTYTNDDSIQKGARPAIIISNDAANKFSNNITIIPCTTAEKTDLPTHISLYINAKSTALAEQITTISNSRLTGYIGMCDDILLEQINKAICIALGLETVEKEELYEQIDSSDIDYRDKLKETTYTTSYDNTSKDNMSDKKTSNRNNYVLATDADKQRFVNDYNNHSIEYMMSKYKEDNKSVLQRRYYYYKKVLGGVC